MNILPQVGMYIGNNGEKVNPDISIMDILCESPELDLFNCDVVQDLIIFKWNTFAMKWHLIGCAYHFFYMIILCIYIDNVYIHNKIDYEPNTTRLPGEVDF
jgi:hypothetical protein